MEISWKSAMVTHVMHQLNVVQSRVEQEAQSKIDRGQYAHGSRVRVTAWTARTVLESTAGLCKARDVVNPADVPSSG